MKYKLMTPNGHNMYDMASMLQKAIRRCDFDRAGYACNELFDRFNGYLWRRLLIVSAEDCFGTVTKEIIALKQAQDEFTKYKEKIFASKAVVLLCMARKNKDADYFDCNYFHSESKITEEEVQEFVEGFDVEDYVELPGGIIPDWVYSWHTRKGKSMNRDCVDSIIDDQLALEPKQIGFFDTGDWAYHIDKTLDKWNPKRRPHDGIDWTEISEDFR